MSTVKKQGEVRNWNAMRGFGLISFVEEGILKLAWFSFAHTLKVVKRNEIIPIGTPVLFTLEPAPLGKQHPIAQNVEILTATESSISDNGGAR